MSAKADRVKGILPIPEDRGLESGLVARPGPGSPCALDYPLMGKNGPSSQQQHRHASLSGREIDSVADMFSQGGREQGVVVPAEQS